MRQPRVVATLLAIYLFQALQLLAWIAEDAAPPGWDSAWHAALSVQWFHDLFGQSHRATSEIAASYPLFGFTVSYYPPFVHLATAPLLWLLGPGYDSALAVNFLFLAVLVAAVFTLGLRMGGPHAGLLGAFMISTVPGLSALMRDYLLDFPLVAMVACGFAMASAAADRPSDRYWVSTGIVLGLGLLTKWTYAVFLAVPALVLLALPAFRSSEPRRDTLRQILKCIAAATLVAGWWYHPWRLPSLLRAVQSHAGPHGIVEGDPSFVTASGWAYYLNVFCADYSFAYSVACVIGLGVLVRRKQIDRVWLTSLLGLLFAYAAFSVIRNKEPRYIAPAYVFATCIAAGGISAIQHSTLRRIVIGAVILIGAAQNLAFNSSLVDLRYELAGFPLLDTRGPAARAAGIDAGILLAAIARDSGGKPFSVCVASENRYVNDINATYFGVKDGHPITSLRGEGCDPLAFDYTIIGRVAHTWRAEIFERSRDALFKSRDRFVPVADYGPVQIYRRVH